MPGPQFRTANVAVLVFITSGLGVTAYQHHGPPDEVTTLIAATSSVKERFSTQALLGASSADEVVAWRGSHLATLQVANGQLTEQLTGTPLQTVNGPHAAAIDRSGRIVAAVGSTAQLFDSDGRALRSLPVPFAESVATLPNGDVAIASPTVHGLIHVYNSFGARRAQIGRLKDLDPYLQENIFLNRGIVLAGPGGTYLYVFANAPYPTVQQLSSDGAVLHEFPLTGASLDAHLGEARRFLELKQPDDIGGFKPILAAEIAPARGTVLIATTARRSGWESIYEYMLDGTKVAEYRLALRNGVAVERLTDFVVHGSRLVVSADDGRVHVFQLPALVQ